MLTADHLGRPPDNKEDLQLLGERGIVPPEFAAKIEGMAGLRNILVHRYFKVDSGIVADHLRDRVGDFEQFLRLMRDYMHRAAGG